VDPKYPSLSTLNIVIEHNLKDQSLSSLTIVIGPTLKQWNLRLFKIPT